jgi:hypothetical protein
MQQPTKRPDKRGTAKLIHLSDEDIKLLSIQAIKAGQRNFKQYVEYLLKWHATEP